ncbi:MAG: hypothetical protein DMG69_31935 [Acidobacteria bacterium]|nr:MAG: hypothetical protein DMG69_31935 [Acidobacteriota bacterium]
MRKRERITSRPTLRAAAVANDPGLYCHRNHNPRVRHWRKYAIFSLLNAALLGTGVAKNSNQLVSVFFGDTSGHGLSNNSYPDYEDYRKASSDVLSGLAAYTTLPASLVVGQTTQRINAGLVSDNYFSVLGVRPIEGRAFLPEENSQRGHSFTAMISESLWRRLGGSDLSRKTVWLNNSSYNVIGVVPDDSARMASVVKIDVFVPAVMEGVLGSDTEFLSKRQNKEFMIVGRLRSGITREQAQAKFNVIARDLQRLHPEAWTEEGHTHPLSLVPYSVVPFELRGLVAAFAGLLTAGVGVVLPNRNPA